VHRTEGGKMIFSGVDLGHNPCGCRAKAARKWFAENGPPDAQPLPLGYDERESLKHGGVDHILAWYARSLADQNYDVLKHPSFCDYACGVMASPDTHKRVREDEQLRKRFPPRPLDGLDRHLFWEPLKSRARKTNGYAAVALICNDRLPPGTTHGVIR
jgi:hypothetical protein